MTTPKKPRPRKPRPATPGTNGTPTPAAPPPGPKPRRASAPPAADEPPPLTRTAAEIEADEVAFYWAPWVPRAMLSFVVGESGTGKSTFMAFLAGKSKAAVYLPGHEEPFGSMTRPRLLAAGCDLRRLHVADACPWVFPLHRDRLARLVAQVGADLVLLDPVDSYLGEEDVENQGPAVRRALEALASVAQATGAAVVGVRHPGKATGNVCPGSRNWRNVPRVIMELVLEPGRDARRYLRPYKYQIGEFPPPVAYELARDDAAPPVFLPLRAVDASLAELAKEVPDRHERAKVEIACDLLKHLLREGELESKEVFSWADKERLSEGTVRRAAERLGVRTRREGFGLDCRGYWSLG